MGDLLPCPFCGGSGRMWQQARGWATVGCENGSHVCPVQPYITGPDADAVAAWNTRVLQPDTAPGVASEAEREDATRQAAPDEPNPNLDTTLNAERSAS